MENELTALLRPLARIATKLNVVKQVAPEVPSILEPHFGGEPFAESGEQWPECPICRTPLTFICQVDTASGVHHRPKGIDLFTFFYCWECSPWGADDPEGTWVVRTYPAPSHAKAKAITPDSEQPEPTTPCVVTMEEIISFPTWDEIDSWSDQATEHSKDENVDEPWEAYEEAVMALGGQTDTCSMIGGYPHWIQGDETPKCRSCRKRMTLLAQIASEDEAEFMWGDDGNIYLFYCDEHPTEIVMHLQCY